jgi:hypothetical protein
MGNRATRRSEARAFRREVSHAHLTTYLLEADLRLDGHPLLEGAISFWYSGIKTRRPFCCACKASFLDDAVQAAAFLLAVPPAATSAGVSAFCHQCWQTLPMSEIEAIATRVLRKVVPGGRFEDTSP